MMMMRVVEEALNVEFIVLSLDFDVRTSFEVDEPIGEKVVKSVIECQ